jgi:homoserine kinase type II
MSVYTELSKQEISELLECFDLGNYVAHKGISAGVENTNYFVTTSDHELVLTLFEKHSFEELPFYLKLGEHLYKDHCKVPQPFRSRDGEFLQRIKKKPAVFIERLKGEHVQADPNLAIEIAVAMADIHISTEAFNEEHPHSHGANWVINTAEKILPSLSKEDQHLLEAATQIITAIPNDLPMGIIHADLFHDNALFEHGKITGIIDWYFAGIDSFVLDIAIAMNDWCLTPNSLLDFNQCARFLDAYQSHRSLSALEKTSVIPLQIQAATRFWLSRLLAQREHQQSCDNITVKDPEQMKTLLVQLLNYTS